LGDATTLTNGGGGISQPQPVSESAGLNFSTISAGDYSTCGVAVGGAGYCWGLNSVGQLGDDLLGTNTSVRSAVAGGLTFITIQSGSAHSCGRTATGVYCWGSNGSGQGGTPGVGVNKRVPAQIVQ
jgi:alpha-tubulin suppressor-like RCC1 family protein